MLSLILGACAGPAPQHRSSDYRFDTVTNTCRQNPAQCAALAGREGALAPAQAAATSAAGLYEVVRALEQPAQNLIEEALAECANLARSEVLLRHRKDFAGQSPSWEECEQYVKDATGRRVKRSMQLGTEMHQVARQCTEERLGKIRPGGFSLEPCYRYDKKTGKLQWVRDEDVQALRESGNACELLGSFSPDVVIHPGDPLRIQAVYDFKFPCHNTDEVTKWSEYPPGHPHQRLNQGELYERALGIKPARVAPRIGVVR